MSEDKGWEFLNAADNDGGSGSYVGADGSIITKFSDGSVQYMGADGSFGRKNSDGSGYYSGADGSFGNMSSDGTGHYNGADGSIGTMFSDGSAQYMGADGSIGRRNSDGSGFYNGADGSIGTMFSDGSAQYIGADGSFGRRNSDGSGFYNGADGSIGTMFSDGSAQYTGADGSIGYRSGRERNGSSFEEDTYSYPTYSESYSANETRQSTGAEKTNRASQRSSGVLSNIFSTFFSVVSIPLILLLIIGGMVYLASKISNVFNDEDESENHVGEIRLEYSASHYKGENYYETIIQLQKLGFSDFRITPLNDLKAGIFAKEGAIDTIEVNGLSDFQSDTWVSEKSVVSISYHSFAKKDKNGFVTEKTSHLVIYGLDIQLPSYLIEDSVNDTQAIYHVKNDEETQLLIFNSDEQIIKEIERFESYYLIDSSDSSSSDIIEKELDILGKKNDVVYLVRLSKLCVKSETLYVLLVSPDNCKTDYYSDYTAILSGIYVPQDTEIRIDINLKDYKGKKYEEVVTELESKGFTNIQLENLQDVVLGVFTKEGTIEKVTINGSEDYKVGDWIDKQAEILISYHGKG